MASNLFLQKKSDTGSWHAWRFWIGRPMLCLYLFASLLFAPACGDSGQTISPVPNLKIGLLLPKSGAGQSVGESSEAAANRALQAVNNYLASTGTTLKAELVIKDTETNPDRALAQLKALYAEGVRLVVGPFASANAAAVLDYANQNGIVLLSPASQASSLAIPDDNLFRLVPGDGNQAAAMEALFDHDSIEVVIPVVRNDVWGDGLVADVTQLLTLEGKTVVNPIFYDPSSLDAGALAAQAATAINTVLLQTPAAQVGLYMLSFGEGSAMLEAAAQIPDCAKVRWYGSSAFANNASLPVSNPAAAFALQQKFRCPSFAPDPAAADLWQPVDQQLANQLGRQPEVFSLTSYDAVWLLVMAYRACADPSDIQQFTSILTQLAQNYYGITGRCAFDAAGDRKFASFEFWGIALPGSEYTWKAFGHYTNTTGQLVIY